MIASPHKHQMRTGAACGEHAAGGVTRRFTPVAHKAQGRGFPLCSTYLPVNWRGRRAPSLSIRFARAALPGAAHRRLVRCPPIGRAATVLIRRCRLARGPQFCLPEHSTRQSSNALEGHFVQRLSAFVGFDTDEHKRGEREPCSRNQRKRLTQ